MKKIITLVGTSVFTKNNKKIPSDLENKANLYNDYINKVDEEKKKIAKFTDEKCCAEVTSIMKYLKEHKKDKIEVYLIASDTIASVVAAEHIKEILENRDVKVIFEKEYGKGIIEDLRIDKKDTFEKGIDNLIKRVIEISSNKNKVNISNFKNIVFNITGGYKGVVAYLAILGEIVDSEIIYIFDERDELLFLPQLPVKIKDEYEDLLFPYLNDFILNKLLIKNDEIAKKLEELKFIRRESNKFKLTELGKLFKSIKSGENLLGGLMELVFFEYFSKDENKKVKRSVKDDNLEIDVYVEKYLNNNEVEIELVEIKSLNQMSKFINEQLDKYKEFLNNESRLKNFVKDKKIKNKTISLGVYLLNKDLLKEYELKGEKYIDKFKKIKEDLSKDGINFKVYYLELPYKRLKDFIENPDEYKIEEYEIN